MDKIRQCAQKDKLETLTGDEDAEKLILSTSD